MDHDSDRMTPLDSFVSRDGPICYGILKPGNDFPGGIPVIKVRNIMNGAVIEKDLLRTSPAIHRQYKRSELKAGDLLLSIRGTTGRVAIVPTSLDGANITQDTARIRVSTEDSSKYLYYALQSSELQRQIKLNTVGQAVKGINIAEVKRLKVYHPNQNRQNKIAQILSTWDKAIEATDKLIENCKAQKKALMQQLLMGKKRFPGFVIKKGSFKTKYGPLPNDWDFVQIGDVAKEVSERNNLGGQVPVLSCSKYDGFVDSLKYFKKKVYSDDTSNYKVVRKGLFGFPSNHIEEGSIGYQDMCDVGIVSPIYTVFKTDGKIHDGYLYKLLKTDHYRQIFSASTNASVDRRGSLRWKEFRKIRIPFPGIREQEEISGAIDQEGMLLSNLQLQLDLLQDQKKALMQQLLTGKRRMKLGKAETTEVVA